MSINQFIAVFTHSQESEGIRSAGPPKKKGTPLVSENKVRFVQYFNLCPTRVQLMAYKKTVFFQRRTQWKQFNFKNLKLSPTNLKIVSEFFNEQEIDIYNEAIDIDNIFMEKWLAQYCRFTQGRKIFSHKNKKESDICLKFVDGTHSCLSIGSLSHFLWKGNRFEHPDLKNHIQKLQKFF